MKRILIALDFSDVTDTVLETATALAKCMNAKVHIVHTALPASDIINCGAENGFCCGGGYTPPTYRSDEERLSDDNELLDVIQRNMDKQGVEATTEEIEGRAIKEILEASEKFKADLIVIGTHEHGIWTHLLFGSVRESIINSAPCPVLVVPKLCE